MPCINTNAAKIRYNLAMLRALLPLIFSSEFYKAFSGLLRFQCWHFSWETPHIFKFHINN